MPPEFKAECQEPFCLRKYGSIAKGRVREDALRGLALRTQKELQDEGH